jgi:thiopeptide-type bacteriocin biosynthesis protein
MTERAFDDRGDLELPDRLRAVLGPLLGERAEPFLAGGLAALSPDSTDRAWVQLGLAVRRDGWRATFAALDHLVADLLRHPQVTNFFFMRKPPGLRVRFEVATSRRTWCEDELRRRLHTTTGYPPELAELGVYEPEAHLFGGPTSMTYVHRVFTADARAWLAYCQLGEPPPAWVYSLLLLRAFLDGAGIVGWEDLDMWERIRGQGGRDLPAGLTERRLSAAASGVRTAWADPVALRGALSEDAARALDTWAPRVRDAARDWQESYLSRRDATIGTREAAAFATIFHWNRGGLAAGTQALLAVALSDRSARP